MESFKLFSGVGELVQSFGVPTTLTLLFLFFLYKHNKEAKHETPVSVVVTQQQLELELLKFENRLMEKIRELIKQDNS